MNSTGILNCTFSHTDLSPCVKSCLLGDSTLGSFLSPQADGGLYPPSTWYQVHVVAGLPNRTLYDFLLLCMYQLKIFVYVSTFKTDISTVNLLQLLCSI